MKLYKALTTREGARILSVYNSSLGIIRIKEIMKRIKETGGRVHICGVLGAGQRGIAELLLREGVRVSGSDAGASREEGELVALGLEFYSSHERENVTGAALLIYTLAISDDNPEYAAAKENGIPTVSRAEFWAYLSSGAEECITVAGSHGKSTVTAMIAHIFSKSEKSASVLSGSKLYGGGHSRLGDGKTFVLEACEYKDSFLKFSPSIAIINNIELDHTDYFKSLDALKSSFVKYASAAKKFVLLNTDDFGARSIKDRISARVLTFGTSPDAFYRISNIAVGATEYVFTLSREGESLGEFCLKIPGIFNVQNAAAAIAAAYECGVSVDTARSAIADFGGIERRLEYIGEYKSRPVFYDYAHHPTEIYAGIAALRAMGAEVLTVVFKSHTYSRTADLWDGFVRSLSFADYVVVGDVFAAREKNERGVSAAGLAAQIGERAVYSSDEDVPSALDRSTRGTVVLMGAADMTDIISRMKIKK